jgi:hypothetical protein
MPLKKISDIPRPCICREHNPPSHMVYSSGIYEWTCPACGHKQKFTVSRPLWGHRKEISKLREKSQASLNELWRLLKKNHGIKRDL